MKSKRPGGLIGSGLSIALAAGLFTFTFASAKHLARPSQAPDQGSKFDLEGKITELSSGKLTVNTEDNIIFQVTYDEKTEIHRKDGTTGASKDLAVGEKIKVGGTLTPAGIIEAHTIDIE